MLLRIASFDQRLRPQHGRRLWPQRRRHFSSGRVSFSSRVPLSLFIYPACIAFIAKASSPGAFGSCLSQILQVGHYVAPNLFLRGLINCYHKGLEEFIQRKRGALPLFDTPPRVLFCTETHDVISLSSCCSAVSSLPACCPLAYVALFSSITPHRPYK